MTPGVLYSRLRPSRTVNALLLHHRHKPMEQRRRPFRHEIREDARRIPESKLKKTSSAGQELLDGEGRGGKGREGNSNESIARQRYRRNHASRRRGRQKKTPIQYLPRDTESHERSKHRLILNVHCLALFRLMLRGEDEHTRKEPRPKGRPGTSVGER